MGRKAIPLACAGQMEERDGFSRAHVQYIGTGGENANLRGPFRPDSEQAAADLTIYKYFPLSQRFCRSCVLVGSGWGPLGP